MKRLAAALMMALALPALALPALALPALALARDGDGGDHRGYGRAESRGAAYGPRGDYDRGGYNGGGYDRGFSPRERESFDGPGREDYRDRNPPPRMMQPPPNYAWRRGQRLPPAYRGFVIGDYARYHLRRPPPGYYWYRSGDNFVLAALASGLIFEVISAEGY